MVYVLAIIMNRAIDRMTSIIVKVGLERATELQQEGVDFIHLEVSEPVLIAVIVVC